MSCYSQFALHNDIPVEEPGPIGAGAAVVSGYGDELPQLVEQMRKMKTGYCDHLDYLEQIRWW